MTRCTICSWWRLELREEHANARPCTVPRCQGLRVNEIQALSAIPVIRRPERRT